MSGGAAPAEQDTVGARFRHARGRLGGAQKSKVGVPAYLRYVNRRAGGWLAAVAYGVRATPNQVTAVSAACSAGGMAVLALVDPTPPVALAVAALLLLGYAFDSADGQLSRVRGDGKPSGEWLDHVVDVAKTASLHAAVLISWCRFGPDRADAWFLVPIAFGIVHVTFFFAMMLRDQLGGKPSAPAAGAGDAARASVVRSFVLLPMDYGVLCLVFVLLAADDLFLLAYGGLLAINVVFSAQSLVKAYRSLARLR